LNFEEWMAKQIDKIAAGAEDVDPEFRPMLDMYLKLIGSGTEIKRAKAVMTWYLKGKQLESTRGC